jgi:hypothetical protein
MICVDSWEGVVVECRLTGLEGTKRASLKLAMIEAGVPLY